MTYERVLKEVLDIMLSSSRIIIIGHNTNKQSTYSTSGLPSVSYLSHLEYCFGNTAAIVHLRFFYMYIRSRNAKNC